MLLLHGLRIHPISNAKVYEAQFHDWQMPGSVLVKALGRDADVYAFAYGQNARLESMAATPALANAVGKLRFLGYTDIVLLGHSTGGVVARLFVEDQPYAGVTKVIQVCAPNDGTSWAKLNFSVAKDQEPFLHSLTKKSACFGTVCVRTRRYRPTWIFSASSALPDPMATAWSPVGVNGRAICKTKGYRPCAWQRPI